MVKVVTAYEDGSGVLHSTPEGATLAELTKVLGRIGAESGLTSGLAKVILDKRNEIERIFLDLDTMTKGGVQ